MGETPTALITGATNGIGAEAAVELAGRGWDVLVHGRNRQRGKNVVARVQDGGGEATFLQADFSDREAVRDLAAAVHDETAHLDALVLNAGIVSDTCRLVWDGVEEMFAVNHLAHYLLTHELVGMLGESSPARIVATSSTMHTRGKLDFDGPNDVDCAGDSDVLGLYARSKLATLGFVMDLAGRLDGTGVTANAFHPGFVPGSRLYRHVGPVLRSIITVSRLVPFLGTSVEEAAEGLAYLTDSADVGETTGTYFHGTHPTEPDPRVTDPEQQNLLWSVSADLTGVDLDWP